MRLPEVRMEVLVGNVPLLPLLCLPVLLIRGLALHVPIAVLRFLRLPSFALRRLVMPIPCLRFLVLLILFLPIVRLRLLLWFRLFLPLLRRRARTIILVLVLSHCGQRRTQ